MPFSTEWAVTIDLPTACPNCEEGHLRMPTYFERQDYTQPIWMRCWCCNWQVQCVLEPDGRVHLP